MPYSNYTNQYYFCFTARLASRDAAFHQLEENTKKLQRAATRTLIPRPQGDRGKDWNLQEAMGLKNDYPTYSNIRVSSYHLFDKCT